MVHEETHHDKEAAIRFEARKGCFDELRRLIRYVQLQPVLAKIRMQEKFQWHRDYWI